MEKVDVSETIAACDPKPGRCRKLIDLMKICEYFRSMTFLDLCQRSFTYEINTCFSQKPLGHFQLNMYSSISKFIYPCNVALYITPLAWRARGHWSLFEVGGAGEQEHTWEIKEHCQ